MDVAKVKPAVVDNGCWKGTRFGPNRVAAAIEKRRIFCDFMRIIVRFSRGFLETGILEKLVRC